MDSRIKKLSVIIPSYKDPLLQTTINSLLSNSELGNDLEIIVVLDGYWPETPLRGDDRVKILHLGKNRGMRDAINAGVSVCGGEFIMRVDEHCMFAKGYDKELVSSCKPNWIITARRFFLNPEKWEVMDLPPIDYEKLGIQKLSNGLRKFTGNPWRSRDKERKDIMIDETMAMQGSMWLMPRAWWDKIGELETKGYGSMYQDSHEMVFKTWKAGGKLMINKNTWFAHKHYSFKRSHNYGSQHNDPNIEHCYNQWKDYYEEIKEKWNV